MSFATFMSTILPPIGKEKSRLTSGFGGRIHPETKVYKGHQGVDISYTNGQAGVISRRPLIYSPVNGVVTRVGGLNSRMNEVTIRETGKKFGGKDIFHRFLHNSSVLVKQGSSVSAGQAIARVGKHGTRQYHIHYEIRVGGDGYPNGKPLNPVSYWDGEKQAYVPQIKPKDEPTLKEPHEEDENHYKVEAGAAAIEDTPARATELYPPTSPSGEIDDYMPRQAATSQPAEFRFACWPNRVPQHEPWPRVLSVNTEHINAHTDEHTFNTRDNPQYSPDHKDVGRVEGDEVVPRGPLWRR